MPAKHLSRCITATRDDQRGEVPELCKTEGRDRGFARSLRKHRAEADMSQQELADRVGASVASVSNWENGDYMPSLRTTVRIADVLGVTLDQLAGRT